jgi:hypothetical protein
MNEREEYQFQIDAFTPDTLPMARLADYMKDLATLMGEQAHVHFVRLDAGSAVLVPQIDREAAAKVRDRLRAAHPDGGTGADDVLRAFRAIDKHLAEDNAVGVLRGPDRGVVLQFPGRERARSLSFSGMRQTGDLDGILIKLGGPADRVPVHLMEGHVMHHCYASRETARHLAPHIFVTPLRVHGFGRWDRTQEGAWVLKSFDITSFEVLDETPLGVVVERLREVPGSNWSTFADPHAELQRLRHGAH